MIRMTLTKKQKLVIQRAVDVQLGSLKRIIDRDCPKDVILYCLEREINPSELDDEVRKAIKVFDDVKSDPETLLSLDEDNLSIFRHILWNCLEPSKLRQAKRQIWRKLFSHEKVMLFYNPN